jgi:hypothetical protein
MIQTTLKPHIIGAADYVAGASPFQMGIKVRRRISKHSYGYFNLQITIAGIIATPTERTLPSSQTVDKSEDVIEVQPEESVKILETQGTFEDMMVWGHEHLPAADDVYVKGVEDWVRFAETVCSLFPPFGGLL